MAPARRLALNAAVALGVAFLLATVVLLFFTQTDPGREQVRRIAVDLVDHAAEGEVHIGRLEGNLLRRARLVDVSIVDAQGRPFVRADTLAAGFSVRGLLRQRLVFADVRMVDGEVVLDQPPGEDWNWARIFPTDPDRAVPDRPGWGDWLELHDVTLVDSRVIVRTEWTPPDDASPEQREEAIRKALSDEGRENVVAVAGGYQNVMEFRELYAELPRVRPAHPDREGVPIEVASFRGVMLPFRPPAAVVRDLSGSFRIERDSLFFRDVRAVLPASRIAAEGVYALDRGDLVLHMTGAPAAFDDLRWLYPALPEEGGGSLRLSLHMRTLVTRIVAEEMDLRTGDGHLAGRVDLMVGDTVRLQDTDLRFSRIDTRLIERLAPELDLPRHGELTGHAVLDGTTEAMNLDADVRFADDVAGTSRVRAEGVLGIEEQIRFGDLSLRFEPLQAQLVRAFAPQLPLRGTIRGHTTLTGPMGGPLRVDGDLTLQDPVAGPSRVVAVGGLDMRDELRLDDLRLDLRPLRVDLLRDQLPELPAGAALTGRLHLDGVPDRALTLAADVRLDDPATGASRLRADGGVVFADELVLRDMTLRADPVRLDLVRPWVADLPAGATVSGRAWLDGAPQRRLRLDADLAIADPASGPSRVAAAGAVGTAAELRLEDLRVRLDPLQVELLRGWLPDLPPGGVVIGEMRLDGVPARMLQVDGALAHEDPALGVSRVAASGGIALSDEPAFRGLDLRFDPLRLELVRAFDPEFPLGGELQGTATLTGSPAARLGFEAALTHREAGELSRVEGRGELATGPGGWASVDLRLQPLSLVTVGRFAPEAGLRGAVAGRVRARGDLADLAVEADLAVADGGELRGAGRFDLAADEPGYQLDLTMTELDLARLTARAPGATDLTGTATARGRGTEPATMRAELRADLTGSEVDGVAADEVRLRLGVEAGLARVDRSVVRIGAAEAELDGSFGLVAGRHGELAYRVRADSLHAFAGWLPGTEAGVTLPAGPARDPVEPPVPADPAAPAAPAPAADPAVERLGGVTRVRHPGAEDLPPGPRPVDVVPETVEPDTLPVHPRLAATPPADSLAGSVRAEGTLAGNLERFDLRGTAEVDGLVAGGTHVAEGQARYRLTDVRSPDLDVDLDARARGVHAQGMEFQTAGARVRYRGDEREGQGHAVLAARADDATDVRLDAEFGVAADRNELRLAELEMRFDTVVWQTVQPAVVAWGAAGIDVEGLELRSNIGGRIAVDGRLPVDGAGDLDLLVEDLEIGHLVELAQADVDAEGRLSLRAEIAGTQRAPRFEGRFELIGARLDGREFPATDATFAYADLQLRSTARLLHDAREVAVAEATLPIDLALAGVEQRMLGGSLQVDLRADSLPLDMVPALTDDVRDLRGVLVADIAVRGTFEAPVVEGTADLDLAAFHLVPIGVEFRDIAGALTMADNVITVDSLVGYSDGPIRITGTVELPELTEPVLALDVEARDAWIIDNGEARLQVDAELEVSGPLTAMTVTGEVRTRRGVIYIPELAEFGGGELVDLEDPGTYSRIDTLFLAERALLAEPSPLLENLRMDLAVLIDTDVWLRSIEANVEIYTPPEVGPLRIRMNGGPAALELEGTINTDRGDYEFMGRRFQLTRGAVSFPGGPELNPFLQLTAQHEVRMPGREGFDIRVILGGTLQDLDITLESNAQPPISQTDLMSFLAFGREASSLLALQGSGISGQATAGGNLAGNVAALATQQLAAVAVDELVKDLERDLAREVGLDVIRISPAELPAEVFTGSYIDVLRGTEIEAGRYLTPRLFVAGQARPTFVHPGARAEYRTPAGFTWTVSLQPRYLPAEPTLVRRDPRQTSVFGAFLFREWRF